MTGECRAILRVEKNGFKAVRRKRWVSCFGVAKLALGLLNRCSRRLSLSSFWEEEKRIWKNSESWICTSSGLIRTIGPLPCQYVSPFWRVKRSLHTILLMPFSILPNELSAMTMKDIIVGFSPLSQGRELWPGNLGKRTPVQSIKYQEDPMDYYSNSTDRSNQLKA